jgi:hypothetical protein
MSTKSLVQWFTEVEDPRDGPALRHNLTEILVVAVCGIPAGAQSWTEIALWGTLKLAWLRRFVPLANGMPSHDTFARVRKSLPSLAWSNAIPVERPRDGCCRPTSKAWRYPYA